MKTLTVSIAAYNMEKYIRQTLDSLMDERFIDDLEIFLIDDGGTDRTFEIAKEYAEKYPNSIFPIHKENGGYGTTVNYSIAHATGKYFKLLDGDDWFDREALYKLVSALKETDVDVIFTPYVKVYENETSSKKKLQVVSMDGIKDGESVFLSNVKKTPGMWGIVYRTEILRASGLKLPAHMLYTDTIYSAIPLAFCKSAKYMDVCVYFYRLGRVGQSVERQSIIRHADDEKKIAKLLCDFYEKESKSEGINSNCILSCAISKYHVGMKAILLSPVSQDTLSKMKYYEKEVGTISPTVYKKAGEVGKLGLFLRICRRTRYTCYWMLRLIPGGYPHRV